MQATNGVVKDKVNFTVADFRNGLISTGSRRLAKKYSNQIKI